MIQLNELMCSCLDTLQLRLCSYRAFSGRYCLFISVYSFYKAQCWLELKDSLIFKEYLTQLSKDYFTIFLRAALKLNEQFIQLNASIFLIDLIKLPSLIKLYVFVLLRSPITNFSRACSSSCLVAIYCILAI